MAEQILEGKTIAILATEGVEQVELTEPRKALKQAGATAELVSLQSGAVQAMNHINKGDMIPVDRTLEQVGAERYDGLLLPGGALNPDNLRQNEQAVRFVVDFYETGKPIAAICHAPWILVEADVVRGLTITSWPSLQTDIRNAGGTWVDQQVVSDNGIITSRKPDDIPAFSKKMIEALQDDRNELSHRPAGQSTTGAG
jgi:protease I